MKNKKITFLIEIPSSYRDGFFKELAQDRRFDFDVFYCAQTEYARDWKQQLDKGYSYRVLPGVSYAFIRKSIFVLKVNLGIWRRLSDGRYDVVIIGGYIQPTMQLAILWCLLNKVPYIILSESHNLTKRSFWKRLVKCPLVKFSVMKAAAFLAMGGDSKDYLVSYGANPADVFFLPNAPNVKELAKKSLRFSDENQKLRHKLGILGNPVIIYVGRLIGLKNVEVLLRAFQLVQKEIPNAGLVIAGSGPLRGSLEALAKGLVIKNIMFAGFIQPDDLIQYYSCADVFTLPSLDEPWGVVVLEAMASGLAVVLSDKVGCAKDLVYPGKTGYIIQAENIRESSSVFVKLLQDRENCKQMGRFAQEAALKWDYAFCFTQLGLAIESALAKDLRNWRAY